jgi:hypothetical protein
MDKYIEQLRNIQNKAIIRQDWTEFDLVDAEINIRVSEIIKDIRQRKNKLISKNKPVK